MPRRFTTRKYRDHGILIVDDDAMIRQLLARFLSLIGYEHIEEACGATEALQILRSKPGSISVVLLDIQLVGMNGLELLRHLVQSHQVPVAVIALTGFWAPSHSRQFSKLGNEVVLAFRYVAKPVHLESLRRLVRSALRTTCELRGRQSADYSTEVSTELT